MASFKDLTVDNMKQIYGYLDMKDRMSLGIMNRRQTGTMGDYQKSLYSLLTDEFNTSNFGQQYKCFFVLVKIKKNNITEWKKNFIFSEYNIDALELEYEYVFKYKFNTEFFDFTKELSRRLIFLTNTNYNLVDEFIFKPVHNSLYSIEASILPVNIQAKVQTNEFVPYTNQANNEMM